MNKNLKYIFAIILIALFGALVAGSKNQIKSLSHKLIAFADEHEDEDEHEDREEDEDDDEHEERKTTKTEEVVEYETVEEPAETQTVTTVVAQGFDIDTDGDKLVDKIDPNPTISEIELFTDDDMDGVPNAHDHFHGEDDFAYIDFVDSNNNGIADDLEPKQ